MFYISTYCVSHLSDQPFQLSAGLLSIIATQGHIQANITIFRNTVMLYFETLWLNALLHSVIVEVFMHVIRIQLLLLSLINPTFQGEPLGRVLLGLLEMALFHNPPCFWTQIQNSLIPTTCSVPTVFIFLTFISTLSILVTFLVGFSTLFLSSVTLSFLSSSKPHSSLSSPSKGGTKQRPVLVQQAAQVQISLGVFFTIFEADGWCASVLRSCHKLYYLENEPNIKEVWLGDLGAWTISPRYLSHGKLKFPSLSE